MCYTTDRRKSYQNLSTDIDAKLDALREECLLGIIQHNKRQGVKDSRYFAVIWHNTAYKDTDIDWEVVISVEQLYSSDRIKI